MELTKNRKPKTLTVDSLIAHIEKQPLESKIKIQVALKAAIENDRKNLETQLSLITENGK